jgi:hypothetical protein
MLVLAALLDGVAAAPTANPPRPDPEWLLGEWKSVRKERDPRPATVWHFRPDGTATVTRGESVRKGTYAVNFAKDTLTLRTERADGTAEVESFAFFFVDRDRFILYADGEWKGEVFLLKRPQIAE